MGIDIYMRWTGQTEAEEKAQYTGYSVEAGDVGYLREAYHGAPYVTRFLLGEAFAAEECHAKIDAKILRERLPEAVLLATYRQHILYGESLDPSVVIILDGDGAKTILDVIGGALAEAAKVAKGQGEKITASPEQIAGAKRLIEKRALPPEALSFVDFVTLAEKKQAETGEPVTVIASW